MKIIKLGALLLVFQYSCQPAKNDSDKYLIEFDSISSTAVLLGENSISTPLYERDIAISPQGDEIIFTRSDFKQQYRCLLQFTKQNEQWGKPEILNISGVFHDIEPFLSEEGNRLYFASNRPIYGDQKRRDFNIWYSDRVDGVWTAPIPLDSIINTKGDEFYPSLSRKGNLFYTATRKDGIGKEDIFMSEMIDGEYQLPVPLSTAINTAYYEFNAFVSPDEDYIIFSSYGRDDGFGGGDLYVSEKDPSGNWAAARNLGEKVNSEYLDYCPFVDWEELNFYFSSERRSTMEREINTPEALEEISNSVENGFGNIYKIRLEELNIGRSRTGEREQ